MVVLVTWEAREGLDSVVEAKRVGARVGVPAADLKRRQHG